MEKWLVGVGGMSPGTMSYTFGASGGTGSALGIRNLQQQWEEAEVQSRQEGSQEILVLQAGDRLRSLHPSSF